VRYNLRLAEVLGILLAAPGDFLHLHALHRFRFRRSLHPPKGNSKKENRQALFLAPRAHSPRVTLPQPQISLHAHLPKGYETLSIVLSILAEAS
jgi:hypothetical protein